MEMTIRTTDGSTPAVQDFTVYRGDFIRGYLIFHAKTYLLFKLYPYYLRMQIRPSWDAASYQIQATTGNGGLVPAELIPEPPLWYNYPDTPEGRAKIWIGAKVTETYLTSDEAVYDIEAVPFKLQKPWRSHTRPITLDREATSGKFGRVFIDVNASIDGAEASGQIVARDASGTASTNSPWVCLQAGDLIRLDGFNELVDDPAVLGSKNDGFYMVKSVSGNKLNLEHQLRGADVIRDWDDSLFRGESHVFALYDLPRRMLMDSDTYTSLKVESDIGSYQGRLTASATAPFTRYYVDHEAEAVTRVIHSGTAGAFDSSTTLVLQSGASTTNDDYNNCLVKIVAGTGYGQTRTISDYDGGSLTATVSNAWATNPDATSEYEIYPVCAAIDSDTAQGGAASTITLAAGSSAVDDYYNGYKIITTGGTGSGQTRIISDYVGSTKIATVSEAWDVTPDATTTYNLFPSGTSVKLCAAASTVDDAYNNKVIRIVAGPGAGHETRITDYDGTTQVATVSHAFPIIPDTTSVFEIWDGTPVFAKGDEVVIYDPEYGGIDGIYTLAVDPTDTELTFTEPLPSGVFNASANTDIIIGRVDQEAVWLLARGTLEVKPNATRGN